jgi:hypothetical protein
MNTILLVLDRHPHGKPHPRPGSLALYAARAATTILEWDGLSTVSLSSVYCTGTVLLLAVGDPGATEEHSSNVQI